MNTYSYPRNVFGTVLRRQPLAKSRPTAGYEDWAMVKLVGWIATTAILAMLVWQTAAADPLWPRAISGILLAMVGVLAGIRLGTDSAENYTKDLQRLNKVLADQNQELQEANSMLLNQLSSQSLASSKSSCA